MKMIYNTELAARAVGVRLPPGEKALENTSCTYCGRPIAIGDLCEPLKIGRGAFMDDAWFATRSNVACLNCIAMTSSQVAKKLGSANCIVYSAEGALPIAKDASRTWFLLTPPKPPFVVTASGTINFQHVVWKAPVTYSTDLIYVAWPSRIMTIRHKVLLQATKVCRSISEDVLLAKEAAQAAEKRLKKPIKDMSHPFIYLDRELRNLNHAQIRPDVRALAVSNPSIARGIAFLNGLSLGETWALATLVKSKPEQPVKPEALAIDPNVLINR